MVTTEYTEYREITMADTIRGKKEKYFELPKGKIKIRLLPSIIRNGTYGAFSGHGAFSGQTFWYSEKEKKKYERTIKIKGILKSL